MQGRLLDGKNAVITGARRGIGKSIVEIFAKNGANIWACIRKEDEEFAKEMESLSRLHNVWIETVCFDLSDENEIKKGIQNIIKGKKSIDILVNNAGVSHGSLAVMTSIKTMKEVFQVNFFGQIQVMQLVLRIMMKQKSGNIINMASIGGIETTEGYLAYGSSKAALIYATKVISHEVGQYGIRVNAVAPSLTRTDMGNYKSDEEIERILNRSSLHRMADPQEIADCVLFLASDRASFITGQVLIADGGRLCV